MLEKSFEILGLLNPLNTNIPLLGEHKPLLFTSLLKRLTATTQSNNPHYNLTLNFILVNFPLNSIFQNSNHISFYSYHRRHISLKKKPKQVKYHANNQIITARISSNTYSSPKNYCKSKGVIFVPLLLNILTLTKKSKL